MNEEIKRILEQSTRALKAKGGLSNKEIKTVIVSMEKLIKRRAKKRVKRA